MSPWHWILNKRDIDPELPISLRYLIISNAEQNRHVNDNVNNINNIMIISC